MKILWYHIFTLWYNTAIKLSISSSNTAKGKSLQHTSFFEMNLHTVMIQKVWIHTNAVCVQPGVETLCETGWTRGIYTLSYLKGNSFPQNWTPDDRQHTNSNDIQWQIKKPCYLNGVCYLRRFLHLSALNLPLEGSKVRWWLNGCVISLLLRLLFSSAGYCGSSAGCVSVTGTMWKKQVERYDTSSSFSRVLQAADDSLLPLFCVSGVCWWKSIVQCHSEVFETVETIGTVWLLIIFCGESID